MHAGDPLPDLLGSAGVPYVACGAPLGHESKVSYVAADERGGARAMVAYLRSAGRTRIATITGPLDTSGGRGRLEGYREVVGDAFDESLVEEGDYAQDSGDRAMTKLLERRPDLDAVFVASDAMALGALDALHRAGPPGAGGRGGRRVRRFVRRRRRPARADHDPAAVPRISREMVRLLLAAISGDEPSAVILPTELVRRASA